MKRTNKRALYESIMKDVAKTVKKHLNETISPNPMEQELFNIFEGLQILVQHADLGNESGDFEWASEDLAQSIVNNIDLICNASDDLLGKVIKQQISPYRQ